jgi:hypothetical protein
MARDSFNARPESPGIMVVGWDALMLPVWK